MAKTTTARRGLGRGALSKPNLSQPKDVQPVKTKVSATKHIATSSITTDADALPLNEKRLVKMRGGTSERLTTSSVATGVTLSPPVYMQDIGTSFTHVTQIRIDAHLFDSIHNAVESAIFGGNYAIGSASHFIREALREHASGAPLKVAHENGTKKSLSIRIDQELKRFWETLPKRHRNNILERAIRTKLLAYQQ